MMRTTPKELFGNSNIEYAAVIGNHDYTIYKNLPYRGVKREFYSAKIDKRGIRKFTRNGFKITIDELESTKDVRIYHVEMGRMDAYFMHIPPPTEVIKEVVKKARYNKVIILTGHVHGIHNLRVKSNRMYGKKVLQVTFPTFLETHKMYKLEVENGELRIYEVTPSLSEEFSVETRKLDKKDGVWKNGIYYI